MRKSLLQQRQQNVSSMSLSNARSASSSRRLAHGADHSSSGSSNGNIRGLLAPLYSSSPSSTSKHAFLISILDKAIDVVNSTDEDFER